MEMIVNQMVIGLISGSIYALISMGLAIVFGLLKIANFFHGVQFMLGSFGAWFLLTLPERLPQLGLPSVGYWTALMMVPVFVGLLGIIFERLLFRRLYNLDHMYGFLLTLGAALVVEGFLVHQYGSTGNSYPTPSNLRGAIELGGVYLPVYRLWIVAASIIICFATWYAVERTKLGASLRAATENATLVSAFGVDVSKLVMLSYGGGAALAGLAGVLAAPIYQFNPLIGHDVIIVAFAIVVVGGMGSIMGSIICGFGLGILEGITKIIYPEAASTIVFVLMAVVLWMRPTGVFGR